jgi:Raf kinase inhibitor-like YbhB/YbcL family protein
VRRLSARAHRHAANKPINSTKVATTRSVLLQHPVWRADDLYTAGRLHATQPSEPLRQVRQTSGFAGGMTMALAVQSPAFTEGATIPREFTCDGNDTPPPLSVSDPPEGTRSFAVIMDDPDAPKGTFTHWLAYDIPVSGPALRGESGKTLRNSFGRDGYGGPCPPPGHGPHRYFFRVYAVAEPSLSLAGRTKEDLELALEKHSLARAELMGRYERKR